MAKLDLTIDPEFKALIPPLSDEEFQQLEANLKADGCRDPLVLWSGILLDGHNRYEICERLDLVYETTTVDLPDRDAAMDWIDANQLGRRNLKPDQMSIIRGRMYNRAKKRHGGDRKSEGSKSQNATLIDTASEIATKSGVHRATVIRDGKKAEFFDKLQKASPEEARNVWEGKKRVNEVRREVQKAAVQEKAALPDAKFRILYADPPWKYGDQLTED